VAEAYIVAAVRTAGGRRGGRLKDWHPADLGAAVLDEILNRTGVDPARVDDVIFGCVTQVGQQAYNIARTCILVSKLPDTVPGVTVDRQCGSSPASKILS
jgi:acetyl-CoA C-acetyltransferase